VTGDSGEVALTRTRNRQPSQEGREEIGREKQLGAVAAANGMLVTCGGAESMGGFGEETRSGGGFLGGGCAGLGLGRGGAPPLLYRTAASLQARGWILHPGPWSVQLFYKYPSPVATNDRSQHDDYGERRG